MLTDRELRNLKPKDRLYRVADGNGLCVEVTPNGSKLWRYRFRDLSGKASMLSFGAYPEVSLAEARERLADARAVVRAGKSPVAVRKAAKRALVAAIETSFRGVAAEWVAKNSKGKAESTLTRLEWQLSLVPDWLQDMPIADITAADVLQALRPLEARQVLETAHRVRARIGQVMRYAVATGRAQRDPTTDLRGALAPVRASSRAAVTHPDDIAALMRAISAYQGQPVTRVALQLAPLVFARPGNLRAMEWSEIDTKAAEWRVPAGKMKMREAHTVPLSKQALALLEDIRPLTGRGRYVFPSLRTPKRPMSDNTINAALRRLGFDKETMTGHGFRAMASTRLNEMGWAPDVIERQLAHAERNKVRAAYNRAQYMKERKKMMQAWADYLDQLKAGGKVVPFKKSG